ncbi:MAG: type II toxin-antitoxin system RelE/ParE family toxin [Pirellulales bacterium]
MMNRPNDDRRKPLVWLRGRVKTPPFSSAGRIEAGMLLSLLQAGETLSMPHSRPLPTIGPRCAELRIRDAEHSWRIVYRLDPDAVIVVDVFAKKTERIPDEIISQCRQRLRQYDQATRDAEKG